MKHLGRCVALDRYKCFCVTAAVLSSRQLYNKTETETAVATTTTRLVELSPG